MAAPWKAYKRQNTTTATSTSSGPSPQSSNGSFFPPYLRPWLVMLVPARTCKHKNEAHTQTTYLKAIISNLQCAGHVLALYNHTPHKCSLQCLLSSCTITVHKHHKSCGPKVRKKPEENLTSCLFVRTKTFEKNLNKNPAHITYTHKNKSAAHNQDIVKPHIHTRTNTHVRMPAWHCKSTVVLVCLHILHLQISERKITEEIR